MPDLNSVQEAIKRGFDHVEIIGDGIIRGERRYHDQTFMVAYIDLADDVVGRSENLASFQEKLVGTSFFSSETDLRWNNYVYFLAGPKSTQDGRYLKAKAHIESDRHFARKFVLSEEDLSSRLAAGPASERTLTAQKDAGAVWSEGLRAHGLGVLLEQRPRTRVLELISNGEAFETSSQPAPRAVSPTEDPLQRGLLRSLTVEHFRPVSDGKTFTFGDVNLIFGPNGTGKTSLLEAIEVLYCGRARRDGSAKPSGLAAEVEGPSRERRTVKGTTVPAVLKARNLRWYGRSDTQSSAISQGFTRFNFLDTDAAFRLSSDPNPEEIKEDLGRLLVGAETAQLWTYLTKLAQDVQVKLKVVRERVPTLRRQTQLLEAEVKRYRETPTEATALLKSYRVRLTELGAKWLTDDHDVLVQPEDRARLERLSTGIGQVLASVQMTPVTVAGLRERSQHLLAVRAAVRGLANDHAETLRRMSENVQLVRQREQAIETLELWRQYCAADVPALASALRRAESEIAILRSSAGSISAETLQELPPRYATAPINDALTAASENLDRALQDETSASETLARRQQLGQSVAMLRRDLHDASIAIVKQTGDESSCPVCGTTHGPAELLAKIEALIADDDASQAEGLRQAVNRAKQRVEAERRAVNLITLLLPYSQGRDDSAVVSCATLRTHLLNRRMELDELLRERERLQSTVDSLDLTEGLECIPLHTST